jgi:hypothetical protein
MPSIEPKFQYHVYWNPRCDSYSEADGYREHFRIQYFSSILIKLYLNPSQAVSS